MGMNSTLLMDINLSLFIGIQVSLASMAQRQNINQKSSQKVSEKNKVIMRLSLLYHGSDQPECFLHTASHPLPLTPSLYPSNSLPPTLAPSRLAPLRLLVPPVDQVNLELYAAKSGK